MPLRATREGAVAATSRAGRWASGGLISSSRSSQRRARLTSVSLAAPFGVVGSPARRRGLGDALGLVQANQRAAQFLGCGIDRRLDLVGGLGACLHGAAAGHPEDRIASTVPVADLGVPVASPPARLERRPRRRRGRTCRVGVDAAGSGDRPPRHTPSAVRAGQARAPGARALDADGFQVTEAAQPPEQIPIAAGGGRKLFGPGHAAQAIDSGGDVEVLVGVDASNDRARRIYHRDVIPSLGCGWHARPDDGQDSEGAPCGRAPIRSRSFNRLCRRRPAHPAD